MSGRKFPIEPEHISLRIGKGNVQRLRELALKESLRKSAPITPTDIVKDALKNMYPELFLQ